MNKIPGTETIDELPVAEIQAPLHAFMEPLLMQMPEKRLQAVREFVSENREIYRAIRISRALFPHIKLRFVTDAGLDDQKIFRWIALANAEFIIRVCHKRTKVYNDRLDRWEEEALDDLVATVPLPLQLQEAWKAEAKK